MSGASPDDLERLARTLGNGKERRTGASWLTLCPAHHNTNTPALWVSAGSKGASLLLRCFAGCDFDAVIAAARLAGAPLPGRRPGAPGHEHPGEGDDPHPALRHAGSFRPERVRGRALMHPRLRVLPIATWPYTASGDPDEWLIVVARYREGPEGKTYLPWSLWRRPGRRAVLQPRGLPPPWPLYALHRLHAAPPDTPVIVVEGEKTATAAAELCPDLLVTTWLAGAGSIAATDWTPLRDREVIWIPDRDQARGEAAHRMASRIEACGLRPRWVPLSDELPRLPDEPWPRIAKWDVADLPPVCRPHFGAWRRALPDWHPLRVRRPLL